MDAPFKDETLSGGSPAATREIKLRSTVMWRQGIGVDLMEPFERQYRLGYAKYAGIAIDDACLFRGIVIQYIEPDLSSMRNNPTKSGMVLVTARVDITDFHIMVVLGQIQDVTIIGNTLVGLTNNWLEKTKLWKWDKMTNQWRRYEYGKVSICGHIVDNSSINMGYYLRLTDISKEDEYPIQFEDLKWVMQVFKLKNFSVYIKDKQARARALPGGILISEMSKFSETRETADSQCWPYLGIRRILQGYWIAENRAANNNGDEILTPDQTDIHPFPVKAPGCFGVPFGKKIPNDLRKLPFDKVREILNTTDRFRVVGKIHERANEGASKFLLAKGSDITAAKNNVTSSRIPLYVVEPMELVEAVEIGAISGYRKTYSFINYYQKEDNIDDIVFSRDRVYKCYVWTATGEKGFITAADRYGMLKCVPAFDMGGNRIVTTW